MAHRIGILCVGLSFLFYAVWIFSFVRFVHVAYPLPVSKTQRSVELGFGSVAFIHTQWIEGEPRFHAPVNVMRNPVPWQGIHNRAIECVTPKTGWIYRRFERAIGHQRDSAVALGLFPLATFIGLIPLLVYLNRRYWKFGVR